MEPIGLCGGGLVALALILVAIIGVALLGGGVVLVIAKLGALVDVWRRPDARGEANDYSLEQSNASQKPDEPPSV